MAGCHAVLIFDNHARYSFGAGTSGRTGPSLAGIPSGTSGLWAGTVGTGDRGGGSLRGGDEGSGGGGSSS